jgi:hypothetical protein
MSRHRHFQAGLSRSLSRSLYREAGGFQRITRLTSLMGEESAVSRIYGIAWRSRIILIPRKSKTPGRTKCEFKCGIKSWERMAKLQRTELRKFASKEEP